MRTNVSSSLEDDRQIIDSFYNRILAEDLNRDNNKYFLDKIELGTNLFDLHAIFWSMLIHEFKILTHIESSFEVKPSKYLAALAKAEEKNKELII